MQNVPHSWATLCSLTWRIRVHAVSHSSVWRADRLSDRSQRKSSLCTADSRAPGPLQPHQPEPDRMLRAPRCTCNNKRETALVFTTAISHTGKHTVSLLLVYKDGHHAQGSGYSTGVLATCATKTGQHMLRGIVTLSLKGWLVLYPIQYNTLHSIRHSAIPVSELGLGDTWPRSLHEGIPWQPPPHSSPCGPRLHPPVKENATKMKRSSQKMWPSGLQCCKHQCLWLGGRQEEVDFLGQLMKMFHGFF